MQRFFTRNELAKRYGVCVRTVDYWHKQSIIPAPKYFGRKPMWDITVLQREGL